MVLNYQAVIILSLISAIFVGCSNTITTNCKELFDQHYQTNIDAYMRSMPSNVDSTTARRRSECVLQKLYEIDSTFVLMNGNELDNFIKMHLNKTK